MYIIYKKQTKKVEMISEGQIKYDKSIFAEKEMTLTEIFKSLPEIKYRESIFKSLKKLIESGLIKRKLNQKLKTNIFLKTSFYRSGILITKLLQKIIFNGLFSNFILTEKI